jgi:hypothetical protein
MQNFSENVSGAVLNLLGVLFIRYSRVSVEDITTWKRQNKTDDRSWRCNCYICTCFHISLLTYDFV